VPDTKQIPISNEAAEQSALVRQSLFAPVALSEFRVLGGVGAGGFGVGGDSLLQKSPVRCGVTDVYASLVYNESHVRRDSVDMKYTNHLRLTKNVTASCIHIKPASL